MGVSEQRTEWLSQAKWGLFMHFIGDVLGGPKLGAADWNKLVDGFDVEKLAGQLAELKAGYFMIALGQNSGHYCSPNAAYDAVVGVTNPAESKCSRRDLVSDLHAALSTRGVKLMVYLPSGAPCKDPHAVLSFDYTPSYGAPSHTSWEDEALIKKYVEHMDPDKSLTKFQRKWESVIREWSLRWGDKVSGWWIDGCYPHFIEHMYRRDETPNFKSFAAAMRAGNPDSLVSWNPGVVYPPEPVDAEEDYTSGEIQNPFDVVCVGRHENQELFHFMSYVGVSWAKAPTRFSADELLKATRQTTDFGGAVTWDVPFNTDGSIADDVFRALKGFASELDKTRGVPSKPALLISRIAVEVVKYPAWFPGDKSAEGRMELRFSNPASRAIDVAVDLERRGRVVASPERVERVLAAGGKFSVQVCLTVDEAAATTAPEEVFINNALASVVVPTPIRTKRAVLHDIGPLDTPEFPLEKMLDLPSLPFLDAGRITLAAAGGYFVFRLVSRDENPQAEKRMCDGSGVELFAVGADGKIRQLFATPDFTPAIRAIYRCDLNFFPVEGSFCATVRTEDGYELRGVVPATALGADHETFLFDAVLTTTRGGAKRKVALFGRADDAFRSSAGYGELRGRLQ